MGVRLQDVFFSFFAMQQIMNLLFRNVVFKWCSMDITGPVEVTQSCCQGWKERWGRSRKAARVCGGLFLLLPSTITETPLLAGQCLLSG